MFKRVLVTGSDGFIGSHLVHALKQSGVEVMGFSMTETNKSAQGDLRDYDSVKAALSGMDAVFHLGGVSNAVDANKDVFADFEINVKGTFNILRAAEACGVSRVVFSSTAYVYGSPEELPIKESAALMPTSFYGQSKLVSEEYCRFFSRRGERVVIARIFNAFGNGQVNRVIPDLINEIRKSDKIIQIKGNAADSRDFIIVRKVVEALILLAQKGLPGEAYNIGSGKETTMHRVAEMILEAFEINDKGFKREFRFNFNEREAQRNLADIAKLKGLGFIPEPIDVGQLANLI
ncbi:MAG: NAD-dependent epimerase/dehydratase family protein [Candidatus Micrarchaeota archaeon]